MITRQVSFKDEEETLCFGIQVETNDEEWFIICACCGSIFDEEGAHDVQPLGDWVDFSSYIV